MKTTKISFFILSLMLLLVSGLSGWVGNAAAASDSGKTYVIGTDVTFAPFEYEDENGDFVGIDMDLLDAIAKDQNFKYQIKSLGFNAAVQALEANQVDGVIAGMSITDERKAKFDFSEPYYDSGVVMGISSNNDTIKSYEDLRGKKVAVKTGTEGYSFAESIASKYGFTIVPFDESYQMYDDVMTGNSVACFEDEPVLRYGVKQNNGLKIVTDKEDGASYGFAVSKGKNQELLEMFNAGLVNIKANGEYKRIIEEYVGENAQVVNLGRWELIQKSLPSLLKGLGKTLLYTIVSLFFAFIIGLIFGFMKVGQNKFLRVVATVFVDIFRGIPLIVLAFFIYFGIPQAMGFTMPLFLAAILTLSLNAGAYVTEIIRGGIQSIDRGQMEAARSLGIPYRKAMIKIVIPQAVRVMIPSFINQMVITLKDTSILSVIGLVELTQSGKIVIARTFSSFDIWLTVAVMYLIVIITLTKIADYLEVKVRRG
ncbi:glutamine ABC transporter permease [Paenibacillus amylolyticus]|uniref:amino acid ABC transporter substrate-binding protein/permease n=1 Tax=Paenibacillus TaxID=44249 RepID=UPI0003E2A10D|nr:MULTISPECIES: amino acid ABC transporter substrate-binding protein/permease [Paenibacillus]ETT43979.1 polar amino acid ABC transporter inner membrane subunit [Paenibacillus sp. FSL H7-689]OMF01937.1 glutamine ABC transporter permease [Paenibacillus amylolyticus]